MLNKRYLYNNTAMADKLHNYYRGHFSESLVKKIQPGEVFYKTYQEILKLIPDTSEDKIRRALSKWVRVFDPNMLNCSFNADDSLLRTVTYKTIQDKYHGDKKLLNLIHSMTVGGIMTATLEYAKQNKHLDNPKDPYSSWRDSFADSASEWYHDKFAKDFFAVCHPNWKRKELRSEDEKIELLNLWMEKNKRKKELPKISDNWFIPKGHRLEPYSTFGYKILPTPGTVWKELGDVGRSKSIMMADITKGIKPAGWGTFKYHYPKEAKKLEEKYPNILTQKKWLKTNLTPTQQKKVDRWQAVEKIVKETKNLSLEDTMLKLTSEERSLLGNHFKNVDARMKFDSQKLTNIIKPIKEYCKTTRPDLYKFYTEDNGNMDASHPLYTILGPGAKNRETQEQIVKLAKSGAEWPSHDKSLYVTINRFVGKNTKYPEFAKELKALRPDWFDEKLRKKLIRERYIAKKKKMYDENN